ncbi:MAG: DUF86 domain-containing protein [Chlamydiales bacterium]
MKKGYFMLDDVLINKIAVILNCLKRITEEYHGHEKELGFNYTKQDSIVLNLQRACEASIDLGTRIIRMKKLDVPQQGRDVFVILEKNQLISSETSKHMQAMVGFRNIAVHDYQKLNLEIVRSILENHLSDFQEFIKAIHQSCQSIQG